MAVLLGDQIHHTEGVVDTAGDPLSGIIFTFPVAKDPDNLDFVLTVNELGSGVYDFTWSASKVGTYAVEALTTNAPDVQQRFVFSVDVDPLPPPPTTVGSIVVGGGVTFTLSDLRDAVAQKFRDLLVVTATSGGSTDGLIDTLNLVENTDYFRGADMLVVQSQPDNVGQLRRIVGSSADNLSISWVPPLPQPIQVGDVVKLYNHGAVEVRFDEYRRAINQAISAAWPENRVPISATLTDPFDTTIGSVVIPAEFIFLHSVEYQDPLGAWQPIYAAKDEGYEGWSVRFGSGVVDIRGRYASAASGLLIRLSGYGKEAPLVADTDETGTDFEWVVEYAAALLTVGQMNQQTYPIGQNWFNRSDQLRAKMASVAEPDTIRVR